MSDIISTATEILQQSQGQNALTVALANLAAVEADLNANLIEREEAIRMSLAALLAGEHIVLLGPPGVGKSLLVTETARRITANPGTGATAGTLATFTLLMNKFTTPEEVFGPVSLSALKQDNYKRVTTNRLPEAHLAFLDEVFKANDAILNACLKAINERIYDNGGLSYKIPLISLFAASNELPEDSELEAFWDRLLVRLYVKDLSDTGFDKFLSFAPKAPAAFMSLAELELLQSATASVLIPDSVKQAIAKLRKELSDPKKAGVKASPRRWGQALKLIQAHALIEGRTSAEEEDLAVLNHVLWTTPEQREAIAGIIAKLANPVSAKATEVLDQANDVYQKALEAYQRTSATSDRSNIVNEALPKLGVSLKRLIELDQTLNALFVKGGQQKGLESVMKHINAAIASANRKPTKLEKAIMEVDTNRQAFIDLFMQNQII